MTDSMRYRNLIKVSEWLFLLALPVKQFYILPSGSFQISDALFMLSAFFWFLSLLHNSPSLSRDDGIFLIYIFCIVGINSTYFLVHRHSDFLLFTAYYIYIAIIVFCFETLQNSADFLKKLASVLKICIAMQAVILALNLGDGYLGTFNDPNQCSFYIFSCFLVLYALSVMLKTPVPWIWYLVSLFAILKTGSMGNFLGMVVFLFCWVVIRAWTCGGVIRKIMMWISAICIVGAVAFILYVASNTAFGSGSGDRSLAYRLSYKIHKFVSSSGGFSLKSLIDDRAWWNWVNNPIHFIWGAGEGYFERFGDFHEVHSSVIGPAFYYGIIPFSFYAIWYFRKLIRIKSDMVCIYIALFMESVFLMNCRQPLFWIILVLAGNSMAKSMRCKYIANNTSFINSGRKAYEN